MAFENLKKDGIKYVLTKLKDYFLQIKDAVKTVNGVYPDEYGNIPVDTVPYAQNLQSEFSQITTDTYIDRTAGGAASVENGDAWLMSIRGNSVHDGYVAESHDMTVTPADPEAADAITAQIDWDTFKEEVTTSGTTTLTYTTEWSEDPATYGVIVSGTPANGDEIVIEYTAEERGSITTAIPHAMVATGWNLYNNDLGYARVLKYSDDPTECFGISGTYTSVGFATEPDETPTPVTVSDGHFSIEEDGYIFVTGGNATNTAIWMTWGDWSEGYDGEFEAYSEDTVDFSTVMATYFPNGLLKAGGAADEINLNIGQAISRVERIEYTDANRALAESSGRQYEFDEYYIYLERETAVTNAISVSGAVTVNDHGMERITYTDIPVVVEMLYGVNLKNRLERDVVKKSSDVANNLTTSSSGKVLDARQGKALNDLLAANTSAALSTDTNKITVNYARARKIGNLVIVTVSASVNSALPTSASLVSAPSGYRPSASVAPVFAYGYNGTNYRYRPDWFSMNTSGQISQSWSSSWATGEFELLFIYHV